MVAARDPGFRAIQESSDADDFIDGMQIDVLVLEDPSSDFAEGFECFPLWLWIFDQECSPVIETCQSI